MENFLEILSPKISITSYTYYTCALNHQIIITTSSSTYQKRNITLISRPEIIIRHRNLKFKCIDLKFKCIDHSFNARNRRATARVFENFSFATNNLYSLRNLIFGIAGNDTDLTNRQQNIKSYIEVHTRRLEKRITYQPSCIFLRLVRYKTEYGIDIL